MNEHEKLTLNVPRKSPNRAKPKSLPSSLLTGFPRPLVLDTHTISPRLAARRILRRRLSKTCRSVPIRIVPGGTVTTRKPSFGSTLEPCGVRDR